MSELVLVQRQADIATVILNRPEKLNALNKALWQGVGEAMAALERDDGVRAIVLRGAGDKAFAPGADIGEFAAERLPPSLATPFGRNVRLAILGRLR
ncbi:MAG: enoyl-CoA hydratase/isomerase family protein, partial [Alphaproteobacteria bacterium]